MTTSDEKRETSDAEQLTALSEKELRCEVTRALEPGPWEHRCLCWIWSRALAWKGNDPCVKCEQAGVTRMGCPVPDAAEGSWADLAERLRNVALASTNAETIIGMAAMFQRVTKDIWVDQEDPAVWLACAAEPRERVIVCLLALQGETP